ncbi:MAG: hypothetical protein KDA24_20325, partial [Deltaproteobacteria bacterium]|nr:hypothetical protein [Deltaproteobacteria bacterium]
PPEPIQSDNPWGAPEPAPEEPAPAPEEPASIDDSTSDGEAIWGVDPDAEPETPAPVEEEEDPEIEKPAGPIWWQ